jgi:FlaA1/EpsC-like NDP-sugar epimerase
MKSILSQNRLLFLSLWKLAVIPFSLLLAFLLRFDMVLSASEMAILLMALPIIVPTKMVVFYLARFHRIYWRFVGVTDLLRLLVGNFAASVAFSVLTFTVVGPRFPRSIYVIDFLICFLLTAGASFAVRLYSEAIVRKLARSSGKGILIYGAGAAGRGLLREIQSNASLGYDVVGFIDDNPNTWTTDLMGVPVLGPGRDVPKIVERHQHDSTRIEEIVIAMPSATGRQMREAVACCRAAAVACKTLPGYGELLNGKVLSKQIRNVSLDDLLGREQVRLDEQRIHQRIAGQVIMITGAAGSIGSELCRQTARFLPAKLIAFDQAESELYKIELELRDRFPSLCLVAEIGDIRDSRRVDEVIGRHGVNSIFHAAAYKHVPMMESNIIEAVRNNVLGTWNLVRAAYRNRVSNFLMISSDKAVNPTSIMGVTKRVAELIVSSAPSDRSHKTKFVSVRFGNVLGSNGSVVPLFQRQIAGGGPVTVTHPDVRRYFMSVREAVQLVLQASTMGRGSETFVLDMGEPIRILDLATNMIRLAGLVPGEDIEISFVGLRPGEKLFEELVTAEENVLPTYHDKIKIFQGPRISRSFIDSWLLELEESLERRDGAALVNHLREMVPEYRPEMGFEPAEKGRSARTVMM